MAPVKRDSIALIKRLMASGRLTIRSSSMFRMFEDEYVPNPYLPQLDRQEFHGQWDPEKDEAMPCSLCDGKKVIMMLNFNGPCPCTDDPEAKKPVGFTPEVPIGCIYRANGDTSFMIDKRCGTEGAITVAMVRSTESVEQQREYIETRWACKKATLGPFPGWPDKSNKIDPSLGIESIEIPVNLSAPVRRPFANDIDTIRKLGEILANDPDETPIGCKLKFLTSSEATVMILQGDVYLTNAYVPGYCLNEKREWREEVEFRWANDPDCKGPFPGWPT